MADEFPPQILAAIRRVAQEEWPGDEDMQQHMIDAETAAYRALEALDYRCAAEHRVAILKEAKAYHSTWEDIYEFVTREVDAFNTLATLSHDDVPTDFIAEHKKKAATDHDWYSVQLDSVVQAVEGYRYLQRTRARVGPIRDLLIKMETIISSECYNNYIQNYGAWGVWEGEGRSFRYPVTYLRDGKEEKRKALVNDLKPEELITGHYKFGANELSIHRALVRIVEMLQSDYGLNIPQD